MRHMRIIGSWALLIGIIVASGCASTGATFGSSVGDRFLQHAPYYAGAVSDDSVIAYLPVQYQRGGSQAAMLDPDVADGSAIVTLLREMNAYLDSLSAGARLTDGRLTGTPPDVHFGCEVDSDGECTNGPAGPFDFGEPRMRLAIGRPSGEWTAAAAEALGRQGAGRLIVVTLEVGQYWPQQTNWRGSKAVELGTGHRMDLPWLSSLETPVSVLQLTGALMGRDGRAVRIGAEGLLARRTGIIAAGFGAQALVTDSDVEQLRTMRRDDLPGQPLVWQVALRTMIEQLTASR